MNWLNPEILNVLQWLAFLMVMTMQICELLNCRAFLIHTVPLYDTLCFKAQICLYLLNIFQLFMSPQSDDVLHAIRLIKPHKVDSVWLSAKHLRYSALSIAGLLSTLFTAVLHHGCVPMQVYSRLYIGSHTKNHKPLRAVKTTEQLPFHPFW